MRRWAKPLVPVAVEKDASAYYEEGTGWRQGYNATLLPSDVQRVKEGRICLRCWEPQEQAFPELCAGSKVLVPGPDDVPRPMCEYPIRARQLHDFSWEYEGGKHIGPATTLEEEGERLEEWRQHDVWTPGSSILIS